MQYEEIGPIEQSEAEAALHRGAASELQWVVVAVALHEDELRWAQDFCMGLASHPDPIVRGNAVLGLGHLARRFGTLSPSAAPIVEAALRDPDEFVRGQAHAAADDLDHFLGPGGDKGGAALTINHLLEVAAPAAVVWEVITDLPSYPAWNPFVVSCRSTLVVGAPISMRVRVLPFWAQPQREWIIAHDPGRLLCYGVRDAPFGSLVSSRCHEVRPLGAESTLYESRFELGGWLAPLVRCLLGRLLARGFNAMTEAIRHRAEELLVNAPPDEAPMRGGAP